MRTMKDRIRQLIKEELKKVLEGHTDPEDRLGERVPHEGEMEELYNYDPISQTYNDGSISLSDVEDAEHSHDADMKFYGDAYKASRGDRGTFDRLTKEESVNKLTYDSGEEVMDGDTVEFEGEEHEVNFITNDGNIDIGRSGRDAQISTTVDPSYVTFMSREGEELTIGE
jgi:hypothetical protein